MAKKESKKQNLKNEGGVYTHEGFVINDIITISKREYGECWLDLAKALIREMKFENPKQ